MTNRCEDGSENTRPTEFIKTCCNPYQTWRSKRRERCEKAKTNINANSGVNYIEKAPYPVASAPETNSKAQNEGSGVVDVEEINNEPLQQLILQGNKDKDDLRKWLDDLDPNVDYTGITTSTAPEKNIKQARKAAQEVLSKAADTRRLLNDRDQKLGQRKQQAETVNEGASDFRDLTKEFRAQKQQELANMSYWPF